jgi:SAM-dependent methyltransferase
MGGLSVLRRWAKYWVATPNTIRYRVELKAILECLLARRVLPGALLDAGAGCGEMSMLLSRAGYATALSAVELDDGNFRKLTLNYRGRPGSVCVHGGLQSMPFRDGAFLIVLCTQVLEHITDHEVAIREMVRVTAPGGVLILSVPFVPEGRTPEQCFHFDPVGHVRPGYTVEELTGLLQVHGCELLEHRFFLVEETCRRLAWVMRLGVLRFVVPLTLVDAESHLDAGRREQSYPLGLVGLFKKV